MCKNNNHITSLAIALMSVSSVASATGITMGLTKTEGVILVFSLYFVLPAVVLFLIYIPIYFYVKKHKSNYVKKLKASYVLLVSILLLWVIAGIL